MRRFTTMLLTALAIGLLPSGAAAITSKELRTIHPEGRASQRGIGPARLEQTQAAVTAELGPGLLTEPTSTEGGETYSGYRYDAAGITIEVVYCNAVVCGVTTKSPGAIMFGHPLRDGLATFRRLLEHRPHWHIDSCHHHVYTALAPGGPGTGIEWRAGRVNLVMIDAGGVLDDCAVL
jgi:hypothetical protein